MRVLVSALVLLVTTACSSGPPSAMPDDFTATVEVRSGSTPPPHHYEWTVTLTGGEATVAWRPGYDQSTQPWTATVPVTAEAKATFYDKVRSSGGFESDQYNDDWAIGGPTMKVRATIDGTTYESTPGRSRESQGQFDVVHEYTKELFPAEVWADFERKQEEWGKTH
ncbi:hypothetical protein [Actinokineospora sp. HUAS TT18]|uniref:hypothetical protein n=1 Tax=Actinokineospora sp. HUAS TT18 TaxID=3447451 RepID=UPI003F51C1F3